jgi:hypothetical protein
MGPGEKLCRTGLSRSVHFSKLTLGVQIDQSAGS